jgi:hypothetical protein
MVGAALPFCCRRNADPGLDVVRIVFYNTLARYIKLCTK